jgi:hypothetical protein
MVAYKKDGESNCILIEGPSPLDKKFVTDCAERAAQCELMLQSPATRERLQKHSGWVEVADSLNIAPTTGYLNQKNQEEGGVFVLENLTHQTVTDIAALVFIGFLEPTGNRYQMVIPPHIRDTRLSATANLIFATRGQGVLPRPEILLQGVERAVAEEWLHRLRSMDERLRLCDREILLGERATAAVHGC